MSRPGASNVKGLVRVNGVPTCCGASNVKGWQHIHDECGRSLLGLGTLSRKIDFGVRDSVISSETRVFVFSVSFLT